jgi:hypothetical protein
MLDTVVTELDQIEEARERAEQVEARPRALEFLQAIYQNEGVPLSIRMRAAIEALPFETPKLSATALIPAGGDFAARLERAIARSREAPRLIEHSPSPVPVVDHLPVPPVPDRGISKGLGRAVIRS